MYFGLVNSSPLPAAAQPLLVMAGDMDTDDFVEAAATPAFLARPSTVFSPAEEGAQGVPPVLRATDAAGRSLVGVAVAAGVLSLLVAARLFARLSAHERFWGRVAPLLVLALGAVASWQGLRRTVYHNSDQALRRARMKVEHLLQDTHTLKVQRQIDAQQQRIAAGRKAAPSALQGFFGGGVGLGPAVRRLARPPAVRVGLG